MNYEGTDEPGYWFEDRGFFLSKELRTIYFKWANTDWTLSNDGTVNQSFAVMSMSPEKDHFEVDRQYSYHSSYYGYVDAWVYSTLNRQSARTIKQINVDLLLS